MPDIKQLITEILYWSGIVLSAQQFCEHYHLFILVSISVLVYRLFLIPFFFVKKDNSSQTDTEETENGTQTTPLEFTESSAFQTNPHVTHNYYGVTYQPGGIKQLVWNSKLEKEWQLYVDGVTVNPPQ